MTRAHPNLTTQARAVRANPDLLPENPAVWHKKRRRPYGLRLWCCRGLIELNLDVVVPGAVLGLCAGTLPAFRVLA